MSYLKKQYHRLAKGLEVINVVKTALVLHVHEEGHAEYREDEHHQE